MRRYDNFSDHDFELFIADLLGAELGRRYEAFARGADGGVDLRARAQGSCGSHVVQCKHYSRSPFSSLLAAVRREAAKLQVLDPQPVTYTFVTSQALTPKGKARIASALKPWIHDDSQVLSAHDLELLLHRHPDVERRQVKLWLTGGTQLAALLKAGTVTRSQTLLEENRASDAALRARPGILRGAKPAPRGACSCYCGGSGHRQDYSGAGALG